MNIYINRESERYEGKTDNDILMTLPKEIVADKNNIILLLGSLTEEENVEKLLYVLEGEERLMCVSFEELNLSLFEMNTLLEKLEKAHVSLQFLQEDVNFLTIYEKVLRQEKKSIRNRTTKGLKKARNEGRVGGRPKISRELVDRIVFLHKEKKLTLREIADACEVSLGTAYKYVMQAT